MPPKSPSLQKKGAAVTGAPPQQEAPQVVVVDGSNIAHDNLKYYDLF